jgi:hypothetical protein
MILGMNGTVSFSAILTEDLHMKSFVYGLAGLYKLFGQFSATICKSIT